MESRKILGNYLKEITFFHKVNPILKILVFSVVSLFVIFIPKLEILVLSSALLLLFIGIAKIKLKKFIASIAPLLVLLIWVLLIQLVFTHGGRVLFELKFIKIYDLAIENSLIALFRFFILIGMASLLILTTTAIQITHGLEDIMFPLKLVGVPIQEVALVLSIALRFIPTFFEESERIKNAQASKGWDIEELGKIEKIKFYGHILIPLFNSAISRSEELANAMEIKGYSIKSMKTRFREYGFGKEDIIFMLVSITYIFFIIK